MDKEFQQLFDVLQEGISISWEKIVFYAAYFEDSYTMKFYVLNNGKYMDCFDITDEDSLIYTFDSIDKILNPSRIAMSPNKRWKVLTMNVDNNGNMKSEFEYNDISDNMVEYFKNWKEKYLV